MQYLLLSIAPLKKRWITIGTSCFTAAMGEVACGGLKDKFRIFWQVTKVMLPQLLGDEDTAKAARDMQAMMKIIKIDIATMQDAGNNYSHRCRHYQISNTER